MLVNIESKLFERYSPLKLKSHFTNRFAKIHAVLATVQSCSKMGQS